MSSWVVRTLRKRKLLEFRIYSAPDASELLKWYTEEVLKSPEKSDFTLEQVVSQSFGFDLLMRQMTDQLCHEHLGVYYDVECYQMEIIEDIRKEEFVAVKGLCLLGFNKKLPRSLIISKPLWVEVRYVDGRKIYEVLEVTVEEYRIKLQEYEKKKQMKEDSLDEDNVVTEISPTIENKGKKIVEMMENLRIFSDSGSNEVKEKKMKRKMKKLKRRKESEHETKSDDDTNDNNKSQSDDEDEEDDDDDDGEEEFEKEQRELRVAQLEYEKKSNRI